MPTLLELVETYRTRFAPKRRLEREHYAALDDLQAAVLHAALAINPNGKRHSHQWCLREEALQEGANLLSAERELLRSASFCELFSTASRIADTVAGLGEMWAYDTAERISAFLGVEPDAVYVHRGTRTGAKALGLPWRRDRLTSMDLPAELRSLSFGEVEDFLCIYKDAFRGGRHPVSCACFGTGRATGPRCG